MELRHLRYFIAVAEEGHITRAAERLGMQQPPLSQQIKAIEQELDVQLFRRKARGVELTEAGARFLDDARATLAQLDRAVESTRRTARGELGRICVGVTSTSSFHPLVARTMRAFSEACPMVTLTLEESLSNELLAGLRSERMDVAFIRTAPADAKDLAIEPLLDEPMVVALPSSHPLAKGAKETPIGLKRLAAENFILYGPPGTGMYDTIIAACHAAGFNPSVGNLGASTQQGPRIGSTLSLIAAGLGITFVPSSLQRMNIEGVAYRRVKGATPTARLSLATRRGDVSPTLQRSNVGYDVENNRWLRNAIVSVERDGSVNVWHEGSHCNERERTRSLSCRCPSSVVVTGNGVRIASALRQVERRDVLCLSGGLSCRQALTSAPPAFEPKPRLSQQIRFLDFAVRLVRFGHQASSLRNTFFTAG